MNRNNTSFTSEVVDFFHNIKYDQSDPLKYHQRLIVEYILRYPSVRGMLIYHSMGSGKTVLAAAITEALLRTGVYKKVLFLSSKSLQDNFRGTLLRVPGADPGKYKFVTLTANNMIDQIRQSLNITGLDYHKRGALGVGETGIEINLSGTVVVVDEAHNLFNGIANGSENYMHLYQLLTQATNIKILFLTGSVLINDPFEILLGFNMIAGINKMGRTLFSESYLDFLSYFTTPVLVDGVPPGRNRDDGVPPGRNRDDGVPPGDDQKTESERTRSAADLINQLISEGGIEASSIRLRPKNLAKFCDRITGLVSYYDIRDADPKIRDLFPRVLPVEICRVPMSNLQYAYYLMARDKENKENKKSGPGEKKKAPGPLQKPKSASSSYRVRSRQFSNIVYPAVALNIFKDSKSGNIIYEKLVDRIPESMFNIDIQNSQKIYDAAMPTNNMDELKPETLDSGDFGLDVYSPKFVRILQNIARHLPPDILRRTRLPDFGGTPSQYQGPGIVYSQFKDSGVEIFARVLRHYGFCEFGTGSQPECVAKKHPQPEPQDKNENDVSPGNSIAYYAIISGDVDATTRSKLLAATQSPDNRDGSLLALFLITSTGAEGISTKYMMHVHVMEPFWNLIRVEQVIGRAARIDSHVDLPIENRVVVPYIYLSDYPSGQANSETRNTTPKTSMTISGQQPDNNSGAVWVPEPTMEPTTDITLYARALNSVAFFDAFTNALKTSSIDCVAHNTDRNNCRVCKPTGVPLFVDNFYVDITLRSPCDRMVEKKIVAKKIVYNDVEYMYTVSDANELHIYVYNHKLRGYEELDPETKIYGEIKTELDKLLTINNTKTAGNEFDIVNLVGSPITYLDNNDLVNIIGK